MSNKLLNAGERVEIEIKALTLYLEHLETECEKVQRHLCEVIVEAGGDSSQVHDGRK